MVALVVGACGSGKSHVDAAGPIDAQANDAQANDAQANDAAVDGPDAPPDAMTATSLPGVEVTPAAGRLTGGGYTMEAQFGHPFSQAPATGGGTTFEGNAPVKP